MRQQAIFFYFIVDVQEARSQKPALVFRQVLIDLRLILLRDCLIVRLPSLLTGRNASRTVGLPPMFAGDRLVLLIDDHAGIVRPSRSPKSVAFFIQYFEFNERAPETYA